MKTVIKLVAMMLCVVMVTPALASESPSSRAAERVSAAIAEGVVPEDMQSNFMQAATRAEFCALAVAAYETVHGEITGRVTFIDIAPF